MLQILGRTLMTFLPFDNLWSKFQGDFGNCIHISKEADKSLAHIETLALLNFVTDHFKI